MEFSPDLVIDYNHGIHISGSVGKKSVFSKPSRWKADNKREGLFIGFGPDIQKKQRIHNLSILDLAPNILHLFGVPIPEDMDGKVRKDLYAIDSQAEHRDVQITRDSNLDDRVEEGFEDDEIMKRLKNLGYLE